MESARADSDDPGSEGPHTEVGRLGSSLSIRTCAFPSHPEGPGAVYSGHLPMSLSPGTRLGSYEVTALIGSGGVGEVWRCFLRQMPRCRREL